MQRRFFYARDSQRKLFGMQSLDAVSAVIFDMDGTLVDSEVFTAQAVTALCTELGIRNNDMDCSGLEGISWEDTGKAIMRHYPSLKGHTGIPRRLHEIYHRLLKNNPPAVIRKARATVLAAHALMPTAIVSSSYRESIKETIDRMEIAAYINFYAGADDYNNCKPAPDGYLKAAECLGVAAGECLVFEDSMTGIQAAHRAGMQVIAVTRGGRNSDRLRNLAGRAICDYSELPVHFFERLKISH